MQKTPGFTVTLNPSRQLMIFSSAAFFVTVVLWGYLFFYLPIWAFVAGVAVILFSGIRAYLSFIKNPCRAVMIDEDGACELTFTRDNAPFFGAIAAQTITRVSFAALNVKGELNGKKKTRAVLILPDMMTADEWRQFRVMTKASARHAV